METKKKDWKNASMKIRFEWTCDGKFTSGIMKILKPACGSRNNDERLMCVTGNIVNYLNINSPTGPYFGSQAFARSRRKIGLRGYENLSFYPEEVLMYLKKLKLEEGKFSQEETLKLKLTHLKSCSFLDPDKVDEELISLLEEFEKNIRNELREILEKNLDMSTSTDTESLISRLTDFIVEHKKKDFKGELNKFLREKATKEETASVARLINEGDTIEYDKIAESFDEIFKIMSNHRTD